MFTITVVLVASALVFVLTSLAVETDSIIILIIYSRELEENRIFFY